MLYLRIYIKHVVDNFGYVIKIKFLLFLACILYILCYIWDSYYVIKLRAMRFELI